MEAFLNMRKPRVVDVQVVGGGTVYMLQPATAAGKQWVAENCQIEDWQNQENVAVEHRYIAAIVAGMEQDGLTVA